MKDILSIEFDTNYPNIEGIEIVTVEEIFERRKNLSHNLKDPFKLEFYTLAFYAKGNGSQMIDFKNHSIKDHTLVYLTKEQVTAFDIIENLKGFFIMFTQEYFEKCFSNLSKEVIYRLFSPHLFNPVIQIPEESDFIEYIELLHHEFYSSNPRNKAIIINSLFVIALTKAEQLKEIQTIHFNETNKIKLFARFSTLLEENFQKNRNANFYAQELAITYKHLNILCNTLIKKSAKKFIDDFIILEAKKKLINSDIKSSELAYIMGFDEITNFIKYFKKNTGLTPNKFKSQFFK